jgi:hypothetical protein
MPVNFYGKSNYPPAGTFLSSYCSGYDLYYRYADGTGGYYDTLQQSNSASCGWPPPPPPFQLSVDVDPVNEGNAVTITVTTTSFNGDLYWRIVHNTTSNADFNNLTSGVSVVSNNTTSFAYYTNADQVTEGTENYYVEVSLSAGGSAVANTSTLSINDTSQTPEVTWSISPGNNHVMQEGDVFYATVTVSNGGNYSAYYQVASFTVVTFSNVVPGNYNAFNIVNGTGTFQLNTNINTGVSANVSFLLFVYDSAYNTKLGINVDVTKNEITSGPSTGTVNTPFNATLSNGVANTGFSWTRDFIANDPPQFGVLNSSGSYTFSGLVIAAPGTYGYTFTFAATGHIRQYSIVIS